MSCKRYWIRSAGRCMLSFQSVTTRPIGSRVTRSGVVCPSAPSDCSTMTGWASAISLAIHLSTASSTLSAWDSRPSRLNSGGASGGHERANSPCTSSEGEDVGRHILASQYELSPACTALPSNLSGDHALEGGDQQSACL